MHVSMMLARALSVAVERAGIERRRFLEEARFDEAQLADIHARLPVSDYRRLVCAAFRLSGDPAFGLHMGERLSMSSFDVIGLLTEQSPTLREALTVTVRYSSIVSAAPRLSLVETPDTMTVRLDPLEDDGPHALIAAEFSMVALLRMIQSFVGGPVIPQRVFFVHARPAHHAEYARFFDGREQFSHEFTGLEIERSWLDAASAGQQTELRGFLQVRAELLLAKASRGACARERVERWLEAQSDLSRPTLETIARDLGTSARTLRRRLQAEHVQFSALLDAARATQAKRLLSDESISIQDAAYALGFGTPSAFSRAFKRWTGRAPKDYRPAR